MDKKMIIDTDLLLPVSSAPAYEPLRDALTEAREELADMLFRRRHSRRLFTAARRVSVLTDLDIWLNSCSQSEREHLRRKVERMWNEHRLARYEAVGGRQRVLDRQRRERQAAV